MNRKLKDIVCSVVLLGLSSYSLADVFPTGTTYQVCFTPGKNCIKLVANLIDQAQQSIYMQAYSFDSYKIVDALLEAKQRGVSVNIILDKTNLNAKFSSALTKLSANNINIWIDTVDGIAHNKVIIVDGKTVETGSFNFTYTAQKYNAENVLIISDQRLAQAYMDNWLVRQKHSYTYKK